MMTLKQAEQHGNTFFLTIKTIYGLPILINKKYYQIILDSLKFCRANKGLKIYAYTILLNHLHLVVSMLDNFSLSDTIGDFKKFTAHEILKQLKLDKQYDLLDELHIAASKNKNQDSKIWRIDCWPKIIATEKFLLQKVKYTDLNARKHGVVRDIENYLYTSYHNHYCNHNVVLKIDDVKNLL